MQLAQDRGISDHGASTLADARKGGEIEAQVLDMEQSLRDAGVLTGPPASGHYRQWLENAVRQGVSIDTIKEIITEHHITPEDFKVFDGMEEVREDEDGDGTFKSPSPLTDRRPTVPGSTCPRCCASRTSTRPGATCSTSAAG